MRFLINKRYNGMTGRMGLYESNGLSYKMLLLSKKNPQCD